MGQRFIVVCPARSGSTMLVHMLRSHPDCVSHSEVMAFTDHLGGFDASTRSHVDQFGEEDDLLTWRRRDPVDFMNRAVFYSGDHLWAGFKIKSDELVLRDYAAVLQALQADRSIKVLHLNRTNLLERYVSWVMVNEVTGVTMAIRQEDVPDFGTVRINPKKAERDFCLAEERQARVDEWFAAHEVLQLEYESLTRDPVGESKRICEFLDVEQRLLTTRTLKIAPHVSTFVSNFERLQDHFAGGPFERLFELPSPETGTALGERSSGTTSVVMRDAYRIPGSLRSPSTEWGSGGSTFGAYVAAVCDLTDLSRSRVLAVGAHTDMIESIARGECEVVEYLGLEPSPEYVEYCDTNPPADNVRLIDVDVARLRSDTQWLLPSRFDVVIVRLTIDSEETIGALCSGVRSVVCEGARMLVSTGLSSAAMIDLLRASGWRADEARRPARASDEHLVCTAIAAG
jgi:LPS sulfotransferase NodH